MHDTIMKQLPTIAAATFMLLNVSGSAQKQSPVSLNWKQAAELPPMENGSRSAGFAGPVAGVHQDKLIIAGGANFPGAMPWLGGAKKYYDLAYVYEQKKNGKIKACNTFRLPGSIAYPAVCSTPQGIVYAGGENENGISDKVFLIQWDDRGDAATIKPLPSLPLPLTNASAVFAGNTVYIAGGETSAGPTSHLLSLDLLAPAKGWKELTAAPMPFSHAVLLALEKNGQHYLYLAGGRSRQPNGISLFYRSLFEFDPALNRWTEKESLPYALSAGTGLAIGNGYLLLFGGDMGDTFHQVESLIAAIGREKDTSEKKRLDEQKILLQSSHPGFSRNVLLYQPESDNWTTIGAIPFDSPVTTTALQWGQHIIIPSGEIKAGIRSPYILSAKIPASLQ